MLDNYNGDYTTEEGEAVATLMKAVGFSVGMNYTTTGSGAQGTAVAPALINNFNYDGGARYYQRIYYGLSDWETMIYDNLEKVGPVYYDGSAPGGGTRLCVTAIPRMGISISTGDGAAHTTAISC